MISTNSPVSNLGALSCQVYEFIRQPKPCLFLNLDRIAWREHGGFAHWHLGQVVARLTDLPSSLRQASAVQPQFEMAQRNAVDRSISVTDVPASRRQAEAISAFIQNRSEEHTSELQSLLRISYAVFCLIKK